MQEAKNSAGAAPESSDKGDEWLSVIDEDVRLLLQIETLFPLEPAYWLYGTSDADHI